MKGFIGEKPYTCKNREAFMCSTYLHIHERADRKELTNFQQCIWWPCLGTCYMYERKVRTAQEKAQWVKVLVTMLDNLNSIPGTHIVEIENYSQKVTSEFHM